MSKKLNIEPRVRSLVSYLNDIENGILKVPAFQRDYEWTRDNIKELFDSIKNSYPIGSILLWKPDETIGDDKATIGSYYTSKTTVDKTYILDGYQRLSTLFGCLTNPEKTSLKKDLKEWKEKFNLYYDLEEGVFIYIRPNTIPEPYQIPVYILMNSSDFRQYTRKEFEKVNDESKIDNYYDKADSLSRAFLDYQIACVDIKNASINEAVDIFSRVNSKGLPISLDWMANALSIKQGFTFSDEIDSLIEDLKQYNFQKIDRGVIFRCIQSSFGKLYIDNSKIETLAKRSDFATITKATIPKIKEAIRFIYEELLVLDSKLLPYNIQLIFIMDFFKKFENPTPEQKRKLKEWFWITTYSNYFTIYSLANQRRAYYHFHNYLDGIEKSPVYNDKPNINFSVAELPEKATLGSVRVKAMALFLLNVYNSIKQSSEFSNQSITIDNFMQIDANSIDSFELQKLFFNHFEPENLIPIFSSADKNSHKLWHNKKDLSFLLDSLFQGDYDIFITAEMCNEYRKNLKNRNIEILKLRKTEIMKFEKKFISSLGLYYSYFDFDDEFISG